LKQIAARGKKIAACRYAGHCETIAICRAGLTLSPPSQSNFESTFEKSVWTPQSSEI
jgi:hypothetical protein